ncbi:MAG TPA: DUF2778 domain-containing protein [Methylocystis sp.]|nr:DUF2778 domain-containing protein [Methylocystis sp.]
MTQSIDAAFGVSFDRPSPIARLLSPSVLGSSGLGFTSLFAGVWLLNAIPSPTHEPALKLTIATIEEAIPAPEAAPKVPFNAHGALLLDLRSHALAKTAALSAAQPLTPILGPLRPTEGTGAQPEAAPQEADATPTTQSIGPQFSDNAPLPPHRPAELTPPRLPDIAAHSLRQTRTTVVAEAPADNRSFLERLFGGAGQRQTDPSASAQLPRQTVAYAATPDSGGLLSSLSNPMTTTPGPSHAARPDNHTAVYDISAHTVYLPSGRRLEAHSGLGSRLDNPNYVHERMHGATPPHLYELTPREQLFHGVQALRLNPVGPGNIFGRAGLLAHTFMLGPNGDSNGCVSFRDYNAFLQAYKSGEVTRLMVVAHAN